jgi:PKHD-type hydroxylase
MLTCIPNVLTPEEVARLRALSRHVEYADGTESAGKRIHDIKQNLQMAEGSAGEEEVRQIVLAALQRNATFQSVAAPVAIVPPTLSRYRDGMTYGSHVDASTMYGLRVDVSFTLFLNDPTTYDGGELTVETGTGVQSFKLMPGEAVVYPTSAFHWVTPVTRGERLAAVSWVQSAIRRADQRELLHDLRMSIDALSADENANTDIIKRLVKARTNLLRMWMEL